MPIANSVMKEKHNKWDFQFQILNLRSNNNSKHLQLVAISKKIDEKLIEGFKRNYNSNAKIAIVNKKRDSVFPNACQYQECNVLSPSDLLFYFVVCVIQITTFQFHSHNSQDVIREMGRAGHTVIVNANINKTIRSLFSIEQYQHFIFDHFYIRACVHCTYSFSALSLEHSKVIKYNVVYIRSI